MHMSRFEAACKSARAKWSTVAAIGLAIVFAAHAIAQAPAVAGGAAPAQSAQELDKLVGPIALYPDDLVAIVLPASTNPLQLVQADRFLEKRKADPKLPVDEKWDDAVKSLLNYPDIVKKMSGDLDWTTALGEAVVDDQGAVLDAIQSFRRKTQSAGNLKTDTKQIVEVEKEVIKIVPADPQVIYVPQYNPSTVVVYSAAPVYAYYPTPYPSYYYPYPPGAALATGIIWGAAIGAAWNGGHYGTNWGGSNNNITINRNTNINTGNINTANINRGNVNTGNVNTTAWKSNKQAGQVSGAAARSTSSARVGDARTGGGGGYSSAGGAARTSTSSLGAASGAGTTAAARNSAGSVSASPRDQFGGSSASRSGAAGGGGAFGGYGSGRQTQADSSRGSASRSSMSSGSARQMPSGGGASRAGAGGAGGRGGGGGLGGGGGRR
jgi:Protein of unknown function (DUF3300)